MFSKQSFLAPLLAVALAGCASDRLALLTQSDGVDIDSTSVVELARNENVVIAALASLSGVNGCGIDQGGALNCSNGTKLSPQDWQQITLTGLRVVDRSCEAYLQALFWYDRTQRRTIDQIGITAATSAAIAGLTGASAEVVAIMSVAFGFAGASIENVGSGLLYDIGPSFVHEIVERNQRAYLSSVATRLAEYSSRPRAMWAIQEYASICLPPTIETEIRRSVQNATPVSSTVGAGIPPRVGQTRIELSRAPEFVRVAEALLSFVRLPRNRSKYIQEAKSAGVNISSELPAPIAVANAISDPANAATNAAIAEKLGLLKN